MATSPRSPRVCFHVDRLSLHTGGANITGESLVHNASIFQAPSKYVLSDPTSHRMETLSLHMDHFLPSTHSPQSLIYTEICSP